MTKCMHVFLLLIVMMGSIEGAFIPHLAQRAIAMGLKKVVGSTGKKAAEAVHGKIEENLGRDVSIGDISTMKVEMVQVIEPFGKTATVTDFLGNRAARWLSVLSPLKKSPMKEKLLKKRPDLQIDFSELLGIYVILNESETAAAESLLSAPVCLLTSKDKYFNGVNDPCASVSTEILERIIERFTEISSLRESFGDLLKVSSEWDSHWRMIFLRLEPYASDLLAKKTKLLKTWESIGEQIRHN